MEATSKHSTKELRGPYDKSHSDDDVSGLQPPPPAPLSPTPRASECLRTLGQCPQEILDFDKLTGNSLPVTYIFLSLW